MITVPTRDLNGYRNYSNQTIEEIRFIKQGQELGFSLDEIRHGLQVFRRTGKLCSDWLVSLKKKREFFKERMKQDKKVLSRIEKILKKSN